MVHPLDPQSVARAMAETEVAAAATLLRTEGSEPVEVRLRDPLPTTLEAVYASQLYRQRPGRIPRLRAMEIPP